MMRVPIRGPTNVNCDNKVICSNSCMAESTLKKMHLSVCYHKEGECYAKGAVCITYEPIETNLADIYTKILTGDTKDWKIRHIVY